MSYRKGVYVVDRRTNCVGKVMDTHGKYMQLRPPRGGVEWDCPPCLGPSRHGTRAPRGRSRQRRRGGGAVLGQIKRRVMTTCGVAGPFLLLSTGFGLGFVLAITLHGGRS